MTSKPTSRWGFLSQAVASVESRLDTILADEEDTVQKPQSKSTPAAEKPQSARGSLELSRNNSNARNNDRLQARLAQAMAKKERSRKGSPAPPADAGSSSDANISLYETEIEGKVPDEMATSRTQEQTTEDEKLGMVEADSPDLTKQLPIASTSQHVDTSSSARDSIDVEIPNPLHKPPEISARTSHDSTSRRTSTDLQSMNDSIVLQAQMKHEQSIAKMQEEMNGYLEKIDTLHHNLQLLSKEASKNAQESKNDGDLSHAEQKLAEKDEKIALLVEEGTKLSKNEMQLRAMIKKLRVQTATSAKDQDAIRTRAEKAEAVAKSSEDRARRADAALKKANDQVTMLSKSGSDMDVVTKERNALKATLVEVRTQLSAAHKRAEEAELRAQSDKFEAERKRVTALQDELDRVKSEMETAESRSTRELADLKQLLEREKDHTRLVETEMLAEQATLESKLETFRVRAEEASAGDHNDSNAKLLRQIETLQSQYSAASSNWQGIEGTLLGRITALEKERDEISGRENDLRRKLREATTKAKNYSKELEEVQHTLSSSQDKQADDQAEAQKLSRKNEQLADDLASLKRDFEEHKLRAEREMVKRLEEEKTRWTSSIRVDSPAASTRKGHVLDAFMSPIDRPVSRRSSTQPFGLGSHSPSRVHSAASVRMNGHPADMIPETPSISIDHDDFFANIPPTPASDNHADSGGARNINDVISASTAAAGPSVQLVERLSANVRKLESEKAASKDELTRLSSQRDEARKEVVNLMRENENSKVATTRLAELEKDYQDLDSKYQATLELVGEKAEEVEELKLDLQEVKQMYRQLCDTMGKK